MSENGGTPVPYPPAPDSLDALISTLERCLVNDIVVFSGGSSVGERDLIRDAIAARGKLLFHGVAVKPGKPTGLGVVERQTGLCDAGLPDFVLCRTRTCSSSRCCDGSHALRRKSGRRSRSRSHSESSRPLAAISFIR